MDVADEDEADFVVSDDEEEEKPRLLLWMLKPHMLVSYEAAKHYLIQRSGTLHVAKILFKLIGPGFPAPDIKTCVVLVRPLCSCG